MVQIKETRVTTDCVKLVLQSCPLVLLIQMSLLSLRAVVSEGQQKPQLLVQKDRGRGGSHKLDVKEPWVQIPARRVASGE